MQKFLGWPSGQIVDDQWPYKEKVLQYMKNVFPTPSTKEKLFLCRECDTIIEVCIKSDSRFFWNSSIEHYIKEHGVKPPEEFINYVLGLK